MMSRAARSVFLDRSTGRDRALARLNIENSPTHHLSRIWIDKRSSIPESTRPQLAVRRAKHFLRDQLETWQSRLLEMGTVRREGGIKPARDSGSREKMSNPGA